MVNNDGNITAPQMNGTKAENKEDDTQTKTQKPSAHLKLQLVFYLNFEEDATPTHEYSVACHQTTCTGSCCS